MTKTLLAKSASKILVVFTWHDRRAGEALSFDEIRTQFRLLDGNPSEFRPAIELLEKLGLIDTCGRIEGPYFLTEAGFRATVVDQTTLCMHCNRREEISRCCESCVVVPPERMPLASP